MAQAIRNQINGTSGQDIMKVNENFEQLWNKVHGDINFGDSDTDMQNRIQTQWLPFQGEGNFDKNFPLDIRFFVPPNVKKLKKSEMNIVVTNYRMDSGIAEGGGGFESGDIALSTNGGSAIIQLSTKEREIHSNPISVFYAGGGNSDDGGNAIGLPKLIAKSNYTYTPTSNDTQAWTYTSQGEFSAVVPVRTCTLSGVGDKMVVDLALVDHQHVIDIPGHTHTIMQQPHTHSGSFGINIAPHTHSLNEGIKISTTQPQNVQIILNNNLITTLNGGSPVANNIDVSNYIKIGEWNTIHCTTSTLARVTIYGILELLIKN